ncbi:hypothetical protein D0869_09265 [Hortaea werneckii]|uniref:PHD-type domain-containing protein n=1 Tax=Hortaea werneckii TaxID=91943 RepID=A0A3M6WIB7_HORWE|nr:hypothetical protein D0869_09265 [Hortaea werneckii]
MGQEVSSAAAGDGNFAVKAAADAAQKRHSAQCEPDTRILSEPIIPSHRKDSQSSKKRKRDPELDNAMSFSRNRTPPHRLSNTFHRDQESPVQTRVRSRSPPASDARRDEIRRLRDHWSPTHRGEDPARSSHFEDAHAHWSKDRTTSRQGRFSWSPASSSRKSRRWTPSPPARAFDRAVKNPRSPDRPDTSPPRREEEPNRSTLYSTAVPRSERYLQKPSRRSPSPPKKHYRNLSWTRSANNLASNPNHKGASRQTPGQRRSVIPQHSPQHSLKSPSSPSISRNLINFNGLKAVPTGPKTALQYLGPGAATPIADTNRPLPTRPVLQDVDESVRAAPHAFLSSRWLPPQEATIQHLRGYFAKRSPGSIFVDDYGYYLLFNDDEEGHLNMDRLVAETPHRGKLFGMYPLTLEAYHNGQQQPDLGPTKPFDSHKGSTKELREEAAGLIANDLHEEDDLMGLSNKKEGDITRRKDVGEKIPTTTPKRMQPKSEVWRLLSPSRTTGRQETDDTSSVSARTETPSELSTSRRTRCHVCKADSSMHMGDLMICSSCPRRWHRACHEVPPFAPDSISDVNWQCRRCIKRQVPLPESSYELRTFAQVATSFEPVPDHSRARQAGSQEFSSQAKNGSKVVKEGTRKSAFPASLHESHPFDQQTAERTSNTIVEGPNPPKRSNNIIFSDRPNSPDGSRTETLAEKVAGAHREAGRGRHQEHYLDFKDDEASDLVERSFTQTAPSTVAVSQDMKANSKTQFKRIKISRKPPKAAQSCESTSASNNVQRLAAPELSAQQLRRPEVRSDKARSAMHDAEIQTAPEVPESPAELRNSFVNESAAAEHLSKAADVAPASSTVGTPLSQPLATPNVAAKPKAKRTRQSFVICSVCQENKAYTSNPHAQACCSMCKQQQQQEPITAKVGEQSTHKNTGVEPQGSKSLVDGSMERSRQVRKEGTSAARPLEAAESRERSNDDVQINANVVNGESSDSLAPNERTASTNLPAHMDLCNSTGPATIPARFQDNQIERTDPVHGRDARTPDDVDVSTSVQDNVCEEQPLDGCSTIEDSRPTKRKRRNFTDGNFPGNSHARAKGSYIRLIGMALCDAPNHRMQLRGIAAWIAEKIPSYELGVGNWEHGLKVTLGAHVGVKGKMMFKAVDFKPGVDDDRHGSKEWYQMHETVASTHERWDPDLKQAVSPAFASPKEATEVVGASQQEEASAHKHGMGNDDAPDDHHYGKASPAGATEDRLGQAQAAKFLKGPTGSQQGYPSVTDFSNSSKHVDVDESAANKNTKAVEDSEDEPLNAVRRRYAAPEARMKAPEHVGKEQGFPRPNQQLSTPMIAPEEADCDAGTLPTTNTWRSPTRGAADDDRSLFEPTTQGEQDVTHTALSLFDEWPEYHPAGQIDREAKIAEIKRRPSRKAMSGKPALYSRLGGHEASQSGHSKHQIGNLSTEEPCEKQGLPARKFAHSIDPFPVEPNVVYYDTLEEFFGLPQHLSPVMYNGQLAYRDGTKDHSSRVRKAQAYFPTGLGG